MKVKRSILNLIIGVIGQIIILVISIILPRQIIVHLGSEVNGLVQSITQMIVYFSLFEAGVGAASLQALYKSIANGDQKSTNEILSATSHFYRKTGKYYFISVLILACVYPIVVESTIDPVIIGMVILLTGMGNAVNYYFQGMNRIYLSAEGKTYIITLITTIVTIISNVIRILLLLNGYNIIFVQAAYFLMTIIQVIVFQYYMKRNYNWIDVNAQPNFKAISQKNSALIHQFSGLIFNNTDIILLTLFTNLKVVSVYALYNLVFSMIDKFHSTVNSSITFALGQTFHNERKQFDKLFKVYEVYYMSLVFSLFTVTYLLITPFMRLYTVGIEDINYIDNWLPILFVSIRLMLNGRTACMNVINIAGHFKKTQNRSIIETVINLVFSLILVNFIGIYGVLLGTLAAVIYRTIDVIFYTNMQILDRSPWRTLKTWLINIGLFFILSWMGSQLNLAEIISSYNGFFAVAIGLVLLSFALFFLSISLFEKESFSTLKNVLVIGMGSKKRER